MSVSSDIRHRQLSPKLLIWLGAIGAILAIVISFAFVNDKAPVLPEIGTPTAAAPQQELDLLHPTLPNAVFVTPPIEDPEPSQTKNYFSVVSAQYHANENAKELKDLGWHNFVSYIPVAEYDDRVIIDVSGVRLTVPHDKFIKGTTKVTLTFEPIKFDQMYDPKGHRKRLTRELLAKRVTGFDFM